jgi:hypothetical protein
VLAITSALMVSLLVLQAGTVVPPDLIEAIGWSAQAGRFYRLIDCC